MTVAPQKKTDVALTVAAVLHHLGVVAVAAVAVAAVELTHQHNLANDSLRLEPAAVAAHHHGMRFEPSSAVELTDQHNLANGSLTIVPAAVALHHHGMRFEPSSMPDHDDFSAKEEVRPYAL